MKNNLFGLPAKSLDMIKDTLALFPEIKEALMFGSRAMGNYKNGSDVDIALKGDVDQETLVKLYMKLNQELPLPYKFDLVIYPTISNPELKQHIDQYGVRFY